MTPLEFAYVRNDTAAMKLLLDHGATAFPDDQDNPRRLPTFADRPSFEQTIRALGY